MSPTKHAAPRWRTVIDSPLGPLTLVAADGALVGLFMDGRAPDWVRSAVGTAAPVPGPASDGPDDAAPVSGAASDGADAAVLAEAASQLAAYFAGHRQAFDLPLALHGTDFQRRVWDALRDIPYGETISYAELARRIGQPTAMRAVGLANGRNPVSIIVPCHRVVGADGSLTGYGGGLASKARLIDLEWRVSNGMAD